MGNSTSTSKQEKKGNSEETIKQNKNLQQIMPRPIEKKPTKEEQSTTDIFNSVTEVQAMKHEKEKEKEETNKKPIPILGGFKVNAHLSETSDNIINELQNKTGRKRYTKYDLFAILKDLDTEVNQQGGGTDDKNGTNNTDDKNVNKAYLNKDDNKTFKDDDDKYLNDDKSMEHIKSIILKELNELDELKKNNNSQQVGGNGCGCDGSGKKKNSHKLSSKLNLNNIIIDDMEPKQLGGTIIIDASSSS